MSQAVIACYLVLLWLRPAVGATTDPARSTRTVRAPVDLETAQRLIASGAFDEAVSLLREAVRRRPDDADAHRLLGTALALVPRRTEAIDALTEAVRLKPGVAANHHALGMALARFVEPERARRAFERALELGPEFAQAHVDLALVLVQLGDVDTAGRHVDEAIRLFGDSAAAAYAHHVRGLLLSEGNETESAEAAFARAVALAPEFADGFLQLGLVRKRRLDVEGSVRALHQAVRLAPDHPQARHELGGQLLRAGRAGEAVAHLREAARAMPDDSAVLYKLARALRAEGKSAEADEVAAKLREIRGRSQQFEQQMFKASQANNEGVELEKEGRVGDAADRYAVALELDPMNGVFRKNLALALCRLERWAEAVQELREVLRLDPNDAEATGALYAALDKAQARAQP